VDPMSALATMSQTMYTDDGHALQLQYPRSMAEAFVRDKLVPAVEANIRTLAWGVSAINRALVTTYYENKLQVAYYAWDARILHQEVLPVLAAAHAFQIGRDRLNGMMLDRDLRDAARGTLDRRARQRLDFS
jgi:hypothetical protein